MLANILPPNLHYRVVVDKVLANIDSHLLCQVHDDVFNHLHHGLSSQRPICSALSPVDVNTQWSEDWLSTSVANHVITEDPITQQPGFDLPRSL